MRILPVLDLMAGQIVRAVAGRRANYRPLVSPLARSAFPLHVAEGYRSHLGLSELYLADLDAIEKQQPNFGAYEELQANGFRLWLDAGIRRPDEVGQLAALGLERIIVALETLDSVSMTSDICRLWGPDRLAFSLDLLPGRPLAESRREQIVDTVAAAGIRSVIVLDLGRVGLGQGTGTESTCRALAASHPDLEILAGGGIRSPQDLQQLRRNGVRGALIATAFHEGRIGRDDLAALPG
jgi:phosphoribosylformimino-5-aminoimidazole carboxamide ribotide isomerase